MGNLQNFLCKKGFHPEKELCLELNSPYYLGQTRNLILKCNACGKIVMSEFLTVVVQEPCKLCDATFCEKDNKITALEQENRELKAYKDVNEDFKKAWGELNEKYKQLRSALEEINNIAEPRFVSDLNEEADLYNLEMNRIQNKINEVLNGI